MERDGRQSTLLSAIPSLIVGRKGSLEAWFMCVFKDVYTLLDPLLMSTLAWGLSNWLENIITKQSHSNHLSSDILCGDIVLSVRWITFQYTIKSDTGINLNYKSGFENSNPLISQACLVMIQLFSIQM